MALDGHLTIRLRSEGLILISFESTLSRLLPRLMVPASLVDVAPFEPPAGALFPFGRLELIPPPAAAARSGSASSCCSGCRVLEGEGEDLPTRLLSQDACMRVGQIY